MRYESGLSGETPVSALLGCGIKVAYSDNYSFRSNRVCVPLRAASTSERSGESSVSQISNCVKNQGAELFSH